MVPFNDIEHLEYKDTDKMDEYELYAVTKSGDSHLLHSYAKMFTIKQEESDFEKELIDMRSK